MADLMIALETGHAPILSGRDNLKTMALVEAGYISATEAREMFTDFYRDSFFVRMVEGSPDINWVKTTNFCDIGFAARGRQLVVFSAIDNLVKGAAGQAVQNMNLMFGLDEKTGLMLIGTNP
jgi:N-acetyl-gamma-glutamyl-phosphate reductase